MRKVSARPISARRCVVNPSRTDVPVAPSTMAVHGLGATASETWPFSFWWHFVLNASKKGTFGAFLKRHDWKIVQYFDRGLSPEP